MDSNASPPSALTLIIQSRHDRMIAENPDGLRLLGGFNALRLGNYFVMWTLYLRSFFS